MNDVKRVLVTGSNGYIGSVLTGVLQQAGYQVTGMDTGYFRNCTLVPDTALVPTIWKDIRDLTPEDLGGFDAVVHLAALSNDPIGNLNDDWTGEINLNGSVRLAQLAREAGVRRFLFSSSCIMYGVSELSHVDEDSPLDPRTAYARSKVMAEKAISKMASDGFSPTYLRNGTVYGLSPRMRFDTVFNHLMGSAVATGRIILSSGGQPWRPVVHVEDVSRAFEAVLRAPAELVHNQAFNTGANHLNRQVIDLAEIALRTVPGSSLEVLGSPGADERTYFAEFGKFARAFPDFEFRWPAERGARRLYDSLTGIGLSQQQFTDERFTRLKWLNQLLNSGQIGGALKWIPVASSAQA